MNNTQASNDPLPDLRRQWHALQARQPDVGTPAAEAHAAERQALERRIVAAVLEGAERAEAAAQAASGAAAVRLHPAHRPRRLHHA